MFQSNIILQTISLFALFFSVILFFATFVPYFRYAMGDDEESTYNGVRVFMLIMMLACLRGAF